MHLLPNNATSPISATCQLMKLSRYWSAHKTFHARLRALFSGRFLAMLLTVLFPSFLALLGPMNAVQAADVRILVQSSPLAGFQYHAGTDLWNQMSAGDSLTLVREPDNAHDSRAVRVEWRGQKLGYLPRRENAAVAFALDSGEHVAARISRLREHHNPWARVLIEVFVVL